MRVVAAPKLALQAFQVKMQNKAARAAVTNAMVSGVTLFDKEAKPKPAPAAGAVTRTGAAAAVVPPKRVVHPPVLAIAHNVTVPVTERHELRFAAEPAVRDSFRAALKPEDLTTDVKKLTANVQRVASKFVLDLKAAPVAIQGWLEAISKTTCASQGITIAGTEVVEAIVEDNTVIGAAQAIHVAVSHENPLKAAAGVDRMERVTVTGNDIHVYAAVGYTRSRHAIFVGNADSVVVRENYAKITRFTGTLEHPIDGIRVFGHFGRYVNVRENHLAAIRRNAQESYSRFTVGVLFALRGTAPSKKPMWLIKDNLVERSDTPVSSNHVSMITEGNFA
jgi:hypothetical protein